MGAKNVPRALQDQKITTLDILRYVYAILHHPGYREKYQAKLRMEAPPIPLVQSFTTVVEIGRKLLALHLDYEEA